MFSMQLVKGDRSLMVKTDSRDVLVWERTNKRGRTLGDLNQPTMVDLYALADIAAKRQGIDVGEDVESWALDAVDDDTAADPTPPAA